MKATFLPGSTLELEMVTVTSTKNVTEPEEAPLLMDDDFFHLVLGIIYGFLL